jgi:hypothetical protein
VLNASRRRRVSVRREQFPNAMARFTNSTTARLLQLLQQRCMNCAYLHVTLFVSAPTTSFFAVYHPRTSSKSGGRHHASFLVIVEQARLHTLVLSGCLLVAFTSAAYCTLYYLFPLFLRADRATTVTSLTRPPVILQSAVPHDARRTDSMIPLFVPLASLHARYGRSATMV